MVKEKKKDGELVVREQEAPEVNSVNDFISQAISANLPVESLERLFELRSKVKAEQAKEAFTEAMSVFQRECPVIKKTKKVLNKDGKSVRYMFAPLDSIIEQIKKPLASADLSYRWETKQEASNVRAICIVTHNLGHSESSEFEVSIDSESYMTSPQKSASALTFSKRYSLCNALGIATADEDTDATDVGKEKEALSAKSKIIFLLRSLGDKTDKKEGIEEAVKTRTQLTLEEGNYSEIIGRLEVLVQEKTDASN